MVGAVLGSQKISWPILGNNQVNLFSLEMRARQAPSGVFANFFFSAPDEVPLFRCSPFN